MDYEHDESIERYYSSNFYTIDIETNGFLHNEPVYIAAWLFQNGRNIRCHSEYVMPSEAMTFEAIKIHGIT